MPEESEIVISSIGMIVIDVSADWTRHTQRRVAAELIRRVVRGMIGRIWPVSGSQGG